MSKTIKGGKHPSEEWGGKGRPMEGYSAYHRRANKNKQMCHQVERRRQAQEMNRELQTKEE